MFSWQRRNRKTLLILSLVYSARAFDLWPFPTERFKGNALIEAGSLGLGVDERAVAFGDFNGDQFLDIVTLDGSGRKVSVHIWDHKNFIFREGASFVHSEQIYNVVPGDFTRDGTLDLLVMSRAQSASEIIMELYVGLPGYGFETTPLVVPSSNAAQPIPLDANGDLSIDLLGIRPGTKSFSVWKNVYNVSNPNTEAFSVTDAPFNGEPCSISNPHSNAVVDLDGDCLADVFLMCDEEGTDDRYFQIWRNDKGDGFSLAQLGRLPRGVQAISFADMDRDGTIDMVFTTCTSVSKDTGIGSECEIHIAFNKQLPLCEHATSTIGRNGRKVCRQPDQLCAADPDFRFDLGDREDNAAYVHFPITDLLPQSSLLVLDSRSSPPIPLPIRLGDANLDGFPDLLFITASDPHGGFLGIGDHSDRTPRLALSVSCAKGVAGCDAPRNGVVGWKVVTKDAEGMNRIVDASSASFLDVDEDGTLDILVQRTGEQGQGPFLFVQNNFFFDAFFLKAIVLNGACDNGWCKGPNDTGSYRPFGVSYSGASYKYTILDTTGRRSAAQVAQLPQTAYQSLLTPYAFFGLGRTNNYIENLFVGSTKKTAQHFLNMEGVIPNSKVVIYPPTIDDGAWHRELYLRPGAWIPWVTLTVIVTVILLACVVFVLHLNEKRADELERRRASHHINFDAL